MKTIEYLFGPDALFLSALIAGLAIALQTSVLSVFVVSKRLAFVGQGVSHAAFGGAGVAVLLGFTGAGGSSYAAYLLIVGVFCVLSGIGIGLMSGRRGVRGDTAIGIVLVGAMALGAVLITIAGSRPGAGRIPSWESLLFGQIVAIGESAAAWSWIVCAFILGALWWVRRPLLLWTHDEGAAMSVGLNEVGIRLGLMSLLAVSIVSSLPLVGVVLPTALLVIPGAAALRVSARLGWVMAVSVAIGLAGVVGGLVLSFERGWPPGACIVLALIVLYAIAYGAGRVVRIGDVRGA